MSINDIILRIDRSFFWISLPEADIQVIKEELCCDIWLKFAPVTVQNCACTNSASYILPLKPNLSLTDQSGKLSNISDKTLTSFSVFEIWLSPGRFRDTRKVIYHVK